VVTKLAQHPLRALSAEGLLLTISTDDPGIFDYTLSQELQVVEEVLGFSREEIRQFQRTAFQCSFIDAAEKQKVAAFFEVP
jgi:adenosine deaminase